MRKSCVKIIRNKLKSKSNNDGINNSISLVKKNNDVISNLTEIPTIIFLKNIKFKIINS